MVPVSVVVGAAVPAAVPAAVCRMGALPALSWCGEVSLGGILIIIEYSSFRRALYLFSHWPLQDILSLIGCCARVNYHCIAPPTCIVHTVAIPLHYYCTIFNPLPTPHRPKKLTRVAAPSPRASLGRRTVCGRTEQLSAAGFEALRN